MVTPASVFSLLIISACSGMWSSDAVVELTDKNFDELVMMSSDSWLLDFYAPWCGHCKQLAPEFEKAAVALRGTMRLGAVDCTAYGSLQRRFDVKGFPTLKFVRGGEVRSYSGARSAAGIADFAKQLAGDPITVLTGMPAFHALLEAGRTVAYLAGSELDAEVAAAWRKAAFNLQGLVVFAEGEAGKAKAQVDRAVVQLRQEAGENVAEGSHKASFVILSKGAKPVVFLGGKALSAGKAGNAQYGPLSQWVRGHALPLVSELSVSNFEELTGDGKLAAIAVLDKHTQQAEVEREVFLGALVVAARALQGRLVFATAEFPAFKSYLSQFGYSSAALAPGLFVLDFENDLYYADPVVSYNNASRPSDQASLVPLLVAFLQGVDSGTISPVSSIPWYNPTRFIRRFERWISKFPESYVLAGTIVAVVLFVLGMLACCFWLAGGEDFPPPEDLDVTPAGDSAGDSADKNSPSQTEDKAASPAPSSSPPPAVHAAAQAAGPKSKKSKKID